MDEGDAPGFDRLLHGHFGLSNVIVFAEIDAAEHLEGGWVRWAGSSKLFQFGHSLFDRCRVEFAVIGFNLVETLDIGSDCQTEAIDPDLERRSAFADEHACHSDAIFAVGGHSPGISVDYEIPGGVFRDRDLGFISVENLQAE